MPLCATVRPFCNKVHQQTGSFCVSSSGPPGLGSRCTQSARDALSLDPYAFPPVAISGEVVEKLQDYSCKRIILIAPGCAQHALVLGSSDLVKSDPIVSAQPTHPAYSTIQSDIIQESVKPKAACLALLASAIKEQGFSEAVAARIEAPQRGSTRLVYQAKWTIFTK